MRPLGSVIVDENKFIEDAKFFSQKFIDAFGLNDGAFHLEFIVDKNNVIYFLEIAARVGGAQVPYIFKLIYDIDLFYEWVNLQINENSSSKIDGTMKKSIGGWLLFPQPKDVPCKVEDYHLLKDTIPLILHEKIAKKGHVFYGMVNIEMSVVFTYTRAYLPKKLKQLSIKRLINFILKRLN